MKTKPSVTPICRPTQYQRRNRAPARIATAVVMGTAKATMPISGFGKPKTEACQCMNTLPQETHGLMSQLVTWPGS